jgi:serine/threonine protein kinase
MGRKTRRYTRRKRMSRRLHSRLPGQGHRHSRLHTRRHSRLHARGGAVLGQGAYGCIVDPPIPCAAFEALGLEGAYISKLYSTIPDDDLVRRIDPFFQTEWAVAQEIRRRIPDIDQDMVIPVHECPLEPDTLSASANAQDCYETMFPRPDAILYMPKADGDLFEILGSQQLIGQFSLENRLREIQHLLQTLQRLHAARITHNDIHDGNIFYVRGLDAVGAGASTASEFILKLADVGLARFDDAEPEFSRRVRADLAKMGKTLTPFTIPFQREPAFSAFMRAFAGGSFRNAAEVIRRFDELRKTM